MYTNLSEINIEAELERYKVNKDFHPNNKDT